MASRDPYGGGGTSTTTAAATTQPTLGGGTTHTVSTSVSRGGVTSATTTSDNYRNQTRTSRKDQLGRPEGNNPVDRSPSSRPIGGASGAPGTGYSTRGSPAGTGSRRTAVGGRPPPQQQRGGGYGNSPSTAHYPGDDYRNVPQSISTSAFTVGGVYRDSNDPMMDRTGMGDPRMDRTGGMDHHRPAGSMPGPMHGRSRSASRGMPGNRATGFHSLDREGYGDRDIMPMREPRERSLDRDFGPGSYGAPYSRRDRSLDRKDPMFGDPMDDVYRSDMGVGLRGDPMMRDPPGFRGTRLSPNPIGPSGMPPPPRGAGLGDPYLNELQHSNSELQRDLANLKKELELTNQKLGSSMHSIKTFWSPELKKERALRKEESAKYSLINDQLKLLNSENQVREIILITKVL